MESTEPVPPFTGRDDLNGKTGLVLSFVPSHGRYSVQLANKVVVALKPQNLKLVCLLCVF